MKWLRTLVLVDKGNVLGSEDWRTIHESYVRSIESIDHPHGSGKLLLRRKLQTGKADWKRNGVNYLRSRFLEHMTEVEGWESEGIVSLTNNHQPPTLKLYPSLEAYQEPIAAKFGGFDFVTSGRDGLKVAIEWETGNISSSHRSMNKLAIALANKAVDAGVLIVPSRSLYEHLTDRVGNITELSGYLEMWHDLGAAVESGVLAITVVEQDELTDDAVDFLPTGTDGRAKQAQQRRKKAGL